MPDEPNKSRFRFKNLFKTNWNPKPVDPPTVDPDIHNLDPLTRSAESIRYSILSVEFWVSPNGQVREWLKNNTRFAIVLAIPAFLVLPVITFALWQFVSWLTALVLISGKLIVFPILALIAVMILMVIYAVLKAIL